MFPAGYKGNVTAMFLELNCKTKRRGRNERKGRSQTRECECLQGAWKMLTLKEERLQKLKWNPSERTF